MNGQTPYTLMPENIHLLLPLPTKAQNLKRKLTTCRAELIKVKAKISILHGEVAFWNEFSTHLKSEYKKTDLALAKIDGRLQKVTIAKTTRKTKEEIKQFSATQLANITIALEQIMKEKQEEEV